MSYYAIGTKGNPIRITIEVSSYEAALLNCQPGEVAIAVDSHVRGSISANGKSVVAGGVDNAYELDRVKSARFVLLQACDWTSLPDAPLSEEKRAEWAVYRQALRDLTDTQPDTLFEDIQWPIEPSK